MRKRTNLVGSLVVVAATMLVATQDAGVATAAPASSGAQRVVSELHQVPGLVSADRTANLSTRHAPIRFGRSDAPSVALSPGLTVTPDALPSIDTAVETVPSGASYISVLRSAKAAHDVSFVVDTAGGALHPDSLGGVVLKDSAGKYVGRVSAPWAYDAAGRALHTSFAVQGDTIVQHVDTQGASFPIVIDPHFTFGIITGTVYFNKNETSDIAFVPGALDGLSAALPPPFDVLLGVYSIYLLAESSSAEASGKCVYIKTTGQVGSYSGSEGDGYCQ